MLILIGLWRDCRHLNILVYFNHILCNQWSYYASNVVQGGRSSLPGHFKYLI
jgi:hypothetical protein